MEYAWREMAKGNAGDDAQGDPNSEIALEEGDRKIPSLL